MIAMLCTGINDNNSEPFRFISTLQPGISACNCVRPLEKQRLNAEAEAVTMCTFLRRDSDFDNSMNFNLEKAVLIQFPSSFAEQFFNNL